LKVGLTVHFGPPSYIFHQCDNVAWHSVIVTLVYYSTSDVSGTTFCYYLCSPSDA